MNKNKCYQKIAALMIVLGCFFTSINAKAQVIMPANTGDDSMSPIPFIVLGLVALAVVIIVVILKKKNS